MIWGRSSRNCDGDPALARESILYLFPPSPGKARKRCYHESQLFDVSTTNSKEALVGLRIAPSLEGRLTNSSVQGSRRPKHSLQVETG